MNAGLGLLKGLVRFDHQKVRSLMRLNRRPQIGYKRGVARLAHVRTARRAACCCRNSASRI